jgi:hypothetical protein
MNQASYAKDLCWDASGIRVTKRMTPAERFANHKAGTKAASVVKRYGLRLMPELYEHLNPMPYEAATQMEKDLAEDLRRAGYTVTGGH